MSALSYIITRSIKNYILATIKNPAKLIMHIAIIAIVISFLVLSIMFGGPEEEVSEFTDLIILKGFFFAFASLMVIASILSSLKEGNAIFNMNDVNFLFVSPVSSRAILFYGLIRLMGAVFLSAIFIIFQTGTLSRTFGFGFSGLLLIMGVYILMVVVSQMFSLLMYSLTNGNPKRKLIYKIALVIAFAPVFLLAFYLLYANGGDFLVALDSLLHSQILSWTPILGWGSSSVYFLISGETLMGFIFLGVLLGGLACVIFAIFATTPDYYEDVLVATEIAFEAKRNMEQSGRFDMDANVKVKNVITKPLKGWGASVIFFKHTREAFRSSRFGFWNLFSIITVVVALAVLTILKQFAIETPEDARSVLLLLLQVLIWVDFFMISLGRGTMELSSHYIYMIPTGAFSKLVWNNWETLIKYGVLGIIIFGASGIILGTSFALTLGAALIYISFAVLMLAANYAWLRFFGFFGSNAVIILLFFMLFVFLLILPGLILGFIIGDWLGNFAMAGWQILVSALCFWLARGVLNNCDMPSTSMFNSK